MSKKVALSLFALFVIFTTFSQKNITTNNKEWIQYYNTIALTSNFLLKSDVGYRIENNFMDKSQFILRTGLSYKITPKIQFLVGFAHLGSYKDDTLSRIELRPYQEFTVNDIYGKIQVHHHIRVEERFFKTGDESNYSTFF